MKLLVEDLALDPNVQRILVNGDVSSAKGKGEALILDGRLASVSGDWLVNALDGREFKLRLMRVQTKFEKGLFSLQLKAPILTLKQSGSLFAHLKPAFFNYVFPDEWVEMRDVAVHATFSDGEGMEWDRATASMGEEQIALSSTGRMGRDERVDGSLTLDYPTAKKLRWSISGDLEKLQMKEDSESLRDLHRKDPVTGKTLGLRK